MPTIFLGGSRAITLIPEPALPGLQAITSQNFPIIIGDAPGADTTLQRHLHYSDYRNVTVFCSGATCRNNIGNWPVQHVSVPRNIVFGFQFYAEKDRAMAARADFGFMLWDGHSPGTLINIMRLAEAGKKARVLNAPTSQLLTFGNRDDWRKFYASLPPIIRKRVTERTIPKDLDREADPPDREF